MGMGRRTRRTKRKRTRTRTRKRLYIHRRRRGSREGSEVENLRSGTAFIGRDFGLWIAKKGMFSPPQLVFLMEVICFREDIDVSSLFFKEMKNTHQASHSIIAYKSFPTTTPPRQTPPPCAPISSKWPSFDGIGSWPCSPYSSTHPIAIISVIS